MENSNQKKAFLALVGSICLTDIPKEVIKVANNGKKYLSLAVMEYTDGANQFGDTHFISCAPKKEDRVEGRNYIIGNFKRWEDKRKPTLEEINNAPTMTAEQIAEAEENGDLPF